MHSWTALHGRLLRQSMTRNFHLRFHTIRTSDPRLGSFHDPATLLDLLHGPRASADAKNQILTALVRFSQSDAPEADTGITLMLLALWPGLDAVYGRLRHRWHLAPEDLAGEVIGRAARGVGSMDLSRVTRIAATLLRNLERDLGRWLVAERRQAASVMPGELQDPVLHAEGGITAEERLIARDCLTAAGKDEAFVLSVIVEGLSQREAAERAELNVEAGRKRYQRAVSRMRAVA